MNDGTKPATGNTTAPLARPNPRLWIAGLVARLVVGGLFIVSAYAKLEDLPRFAEEIRSYQMVPVEITNAMAYVIPWVELLAGLLLLTTLWRAEARNLLLVMLAVFTVAKGTALARGLNIECGCGGDLAALKLIFDNPQGVLTNVALMALLVVDREAQLRSGAARPGAEESTAADKGQDGEAQPAAE